MYSSIAILALSNYRWGSLFDVNLISIRLSRRIAFISFCSYNKIKHKVTILVLLLIVNNHEVYCVLKQQPWPTFIAKYTPELRLTSYFVYAYKILIELFISVSANIKLICLVVYIETEAYRSFRLTSHDLDPSVSLLFCL